MDCSTPGSPVPHLAEPLMAQPLILLGSLLLPDELHDRISGWRSCSLCCAFSAMKCVSWLNVMLQCCTSGLFNIVQDFIVVDQEFYKPLNSGPGGGIEVREGKPKSNIKILF